MKDRADVVEAMIGELSEIHGGHPVLSELLAYIHYMGERTFFEEIGSFIGASPAAAPALESSRKKNTLLTALRPSREKKQNASEPPVKEKRNRAPIKRRRHALFNCVPSRNSIQQRPDVELSSQPPSATTCRRSAPLPAESQKSSAPVTPSPVRPQVPISSKPSRSPDSFVHFQSISPDFTARSGPPPPAFSFSSSIINGYRTSPNAASLFFPDYSIYSPPLLPG